MNTDQTRIAFRVSSVFDPWPQMSGFTIRISNFDALK